MPSLRLTLIILCLLPAFSGLAAEKNPGQAKTARFAKIHDGKHWTWFARQDQYDAHKADIEALYGYADRAFDKLCDAWGLKPPKDRYAMLVFDKPGGGFATGDIGEAHQVTMAAYLQIGAPEDISGLLAGQVPGYDATAVRAILRAREKWTSLPTNSARRASLQSAYLKGDYRASLR